MIYDGNWAACAGCAPLVAAREWKSLADRAMRVRRTTRAATPHIEGYERAEILGLWHVLESHLSGEPGGER